MSELPKLSRREWFRLRPHHQNKMLSESLTEPTTDSQPPIILTDGLAPIEHPPNHDGLDLSQLPPMRESTLSETQVASLFSDIKNLATDILLMQRTNRAARADATTVDSAHQLDRAQSALISGSVPRVQIRYRWQNSLWIDTLKRESDGFHIVRIAHRSTPG